MIKEGELIKKYRDKVWLWNRYSEDKLSERQIAELCKAGNTTIHRWLKRFSIQTRSSGEGHHLRKGNHCRLSLEAIEWLNGELLGDGYLRNRHGWSAGINYSSKYFEYIQYISDTLKSFGIEQVGKIQKAYSKKSNTYFYTYKSRDYKELLLIHKKWYPEGKKIVPKDISLTPLTCRQWYIGDGSLKHFKNNNSTIRLATCGFIINEVDWLVKQLNEINIKSKRTPLSNEIYISICSTKEFLNYIGKCPVKCYQYKFL